MTPLDKTTALRGASADEARAAMEQLNAEASPLHIWLRTQANAPAQRPWFRSEGVAASGQIAAGRVGAGQIKAVPHRWRWRDISPYLDRIAEIARTAEVPPVEFAERQQFLLTNPGLAGRLQVASAIRCAVSIYNPGDVARVHIHTPNASRTILSDAGGYTTVEGERCEAGRGDLILTPHGTWHDHGNDGAAPVVWVDILDYPLLEYLDCIWLDDHYTGAREGNSDAQAQTHHNGYSGRLYGRGGILPAFTANQRGIGAGATPMFHYRGSDIRSALRALEGEAGDGEEGIILRFVNPMTGGPVFPTLDYSAQLLRPGEETGLKRETASTFYIVLEGEGATEIAGERFDWRENDMFVVPNFLWRRHLNTGRKDAVLYAVSDRALMEKLGQYRAQRRLPDGGVQEIAADR